MKMYKSNELPNDLRFFLRKTQQHLQLWPNARVSSLNKIFVTISLKFTKN